MAVKRARGELFDDGNVVDQFVGGAGLILDSDCSEDMLGKRSGAVVAKLDDGHELVPIALDAGSEWGERIAQAAVVDYLENLGEVFT